MKRHGLLLLGATAVALTGCGGAGGGSGGVGSGGFGGGVFRGSNVDAGLVMSGDPRSFEGGEYQRSGGAKAIEASSIYAAGGTGRGMTVAVIDTGIDVDHPDLAPAIRNESTDIVTNNRAYLDDIHGHGTAVAGIIAARRDGIGTHGVAFEADLLAIRADALGSCPAACAFEQSDLEAATDYAVLHGADVVNYSLAGSNGLSSGLKVALADAAAADRLLVFAAGNDGAAAPTHPGMFAATAESRGRALVVGAVDADNVLASFSNKAGSARNSFLVAPGLDIPTTGLGGGQASVSGTSAAAPLVSGAAASLWQAAPHLSADEVATLLLTTATDLGAKGVDAIYGYGLLNLKAAVAPQGDLVVPTGAHVASGGVELQHTTLRLAQAFAGRKDLAGALDGIMALDAYGRAYAVDLLEFVEDGPDAIDLKAWLAPTNRETVAQPLLQRGLARLHLRRLEPEAGDVSGERIELEDVEIELSLSPRLQLLAFSGGQAPMSDLGRWQAAGRTQLLSDASLPGAHAGLVESGGLGLDFMAAPGWRARFVMQADGLDPGLDAQGEGRASYRFELEHRISADAAFTLSAGRLAEPAGPLGSVAEGALDLGSQAATSFAALEGRLRLAPGTFGFGRAALGRTSLGSSGGGIELDAFWSGAFALGLTREGILADDDALTAMISQPLRAEAAAMSLDVPVARAIDGSVTRERRRIDLSPSGREIDLEIAYGRALTPSSRIGANLMLRTEPGHDAQAAPELVGTINYRLAF